MRRVLCAGFALGLALAAAAQVAIPYITDFDSSLGFTPGSLDNQQGWSVLQGEADVITGTLVGNQCVVLNPASNAVSAVAIPFAPYTFLPPPAPPVMWVDCVLQPVASSVSNITSYIYLGTSLAILVQTNGSTGQVFTFDGANWVSSSHSAFTINSSGADTAWMWLTFRLDFSTDKWDLDMLEPDGSKKILEADQPFLDNSFTYLPFFEFQGDASAPSYLYLVQAGLTTLLFTDVNNDGIPDDWEIAHGLTDMTQNYRYQDPTGKFYPDTGKTKTVLDDYIDGTDPHDYYSGVLPTLTSLVDPSGEPGAQGLVSVKVTTASGVALANAPLTLSVTGSSTQIAATPGGTSSNSVTVKADANGVASAYVSFITLASDTLTATANAVASDGSTIPTSISVTINPPPGIQLWLKADAGVTESSGYVSQWQDQSSPGGHNATASYGSQPIFVPSGLSGKPVISFTGTSFMQLPQIIAAASPVEMFVVLKAASANPGTEEVPFNQLRYPNAAGHLTDGSWTNYSQDMGLLATDLTAYHVYNASSAASSWVGRLDGVTVYTSTTNPINYDVGPQIGAYGSNFTEYGYFTGDIAEIIVYSRVLSDPERAAVNAYLGTKYGLYTTPAAAPSNLAATAISSLQISLTWSDNLSSTNTLYTIERKSAGGNYQFVTQVSNTLSYLDSGLSPNTAYTYRVSSATVAGGSAGYSNEATATTFNSSNDAMPSDMRLWLKADAGVDQGQGKLNYWADQTTNHLDAVQSASGADYRPSRIMDPVADGKTLPVIAFNGASFLQLPAIFSSSPAAVEMFVVLKAASASPGRDEVPFHQLRYPNAQGHLSDTSWSSGHDLGLPTQDLTTYHIYNMSSAASNWVGRLDGVTVSTSTSNNAYYDIGPQIGAVGAGSFFTGDIAEIIVYSRVLSDPERAAVNAYLGTKYGLYTAPAAAPSNLAATAISSSQISLTWSDSLSSVDTIYTIQRKLASGGTYQTVTQVHNTLSYIDSDPGLSPNTAYTYRVSSATVAGSSAGYSNEATATTFNSSNDAMPSDMRLWLKADAGVDQGQGKLNYWADQTTNHLDAVQSSGGADYRPSRIMDPVADGKTLPVIAFNGASFLQLPAIFSSSPAAVEMFVVLKAASANPGRDEVAFHQLRYPNAQGHLSDTSWSNGHDLGLPTQDLTTYHIYNMSSAANNWVGRLDGVTVSTSTSNSAYYDIGPQIGAVGAGSFFTGDIAEIIVYGYMLAPANRNAVEQYLAAKYAITSPPALAPPSNLTLLPVSPTQIEVQWQAPAIGNYTYLLERSTDGVNFTQVATVSGALNFIDTGLTAGVNYTYRIRTQGFAGTSGYSTTISATIMAVSGSDGHLALILYTPLQP